MNLSCFHLKNGIETRKYGIKLLKLVQDEYSWLIFITYMRFIDDLKFVRILFKFSLNTLDFNNGFFKMTEQWILFESLEGSLKQLLGIINLV